MSRSSSAASGDRVTLEVGGTSDSAFNEIDLSGKKGADSAKDEEDRDDDDRGDRGVDRKDELDEDRGSRGEGDSDDEGYSPDRARLRASRRSERKLRSRSSRLETQVVRMAAQLEQLEGTARTAIVGDAKSKMEQAQQKYQAAKEKAKKAFDEGKSDDFMRAQDEQRAAENEFGAAARAVQEIENNPAGNTGGSAVRNRWMSENDWFNPESQDENSELARKVSREVAQDGFETKSQAHFDELDRRLRKLKPKGPWSEGGDEDEDEDRDTRRGKGDRDEGGRGGRERDRGPRGGANGNGGGGLDGDTDWAKNTKVPRQLIENYQAAGFDVNDPKVKERMLSRYNATKSGMSGGTVNVG